MVGVIGAGNIKAKVGQQIKNEQEVAKTEKGQTNNNIGGDTTMNAPLMLMVTLGCNVGCDHCCFACNPDKLQLSISESEMLSYIEQAYEFGSRSVSFTGGEPMLLDLSLPMALANHLGMQVDLRTNAFWAKDYGVAFQTLRSLQLQGVTRLGLSYDSYHAKAIPPDNIVNVLRASRELCVPVYLDWIGLHSRKQVLDYLQISEDELRYVGPPLKVGAATKLGNKYFSYTYANDLHSDCRSEMLLTIFPGGYVSLHPCCWVNPALIRKIDSNGWLKGLEEEMNSSPMVNFLKNYGVRGLIKKAREECPELVKPYYSRHCEACYDLLGTLFPDEVQELPWYLEELKSSKEMVKV